jgi:polyphenol oxidase
MLIPNWPAPSVVKAYTTIREGGYSQAPYESFNLADHVGDRPEAVAANRGALIEMLGLPNEPVWLKQVHGIQAVRATEQHRDCEADAVYTTEFEQVCVVMTADCLPVLFCDRAGTRVAAAHAGWRGLANGVLEKSVQALDLPPQDILVWLGPAIGPNAFEVGDEVRETFMAFLPEAAQAFKSTGEGHWLADLYLLARQRLAHEGVTAVYGGDFCTYTDAKRFYSYRRDKVTGRMASLIWLTG